ncbi:MAG: hypothetical protein IBX55_06325 [Methyloprofundus sp.]|nr:hypothetical protein [Methyloprofundus sp.]MBW6453118.1 hypothetical protein [Methyloprofundus sp.]
MQSITINITNKNTQEKVIWSLNHLKEDGVEIVSQEDIGDLKLLAATRNEASISFDEYLKNEH